MTNGSRGRRTTGIGIALIVGAVVAWYVLVPSWPAFQMHRRIRPGMTLREVPALQKGWLYFRGRNLMATARADLLHLTITDEQGNRQSFDNRDAFYTALESRMKEMDQDWIFTIGFTGVPRRAFFQVIFGSDARVKKVTPIELAD